MKELPRYINCRTIEEQNMILDIFEMLGYKWNQGQEPRDYISKTPLMHYFICHEYERFGNQKGLHHNATEAKNLQNMYILLKRKVQNEIRQ